MHRDQQFILQEEIKSNPKIGDALQAEESQITSFAKENDLKGVDGNISYIKDPYEAAKGCDAIAVMTEWDIYKSLDYKKIYIELKTIL